MGKGGMYGGGPGMGGMGGDPNDPRMQQMQDAPPGLLMMLVCCLCTVGVAFLAIFIWAIFTLLDSVDAKDAACAENSNIWWFCIVFFVVIPIVGCVVGIIRNLGEENSIFLQLIPNLFNFAVGVWGVLMWLNMTKECEGFYAQEYPSLLLLFQILVVFMFVIFLLVLCTTCLMIGTLGAALSGGSGAPRYDDIPDSVPEDTTPKTEEYV